MIALLLAAAAAAASAGPGPATAAPPAGAGPGSALAAPPPAQAPAGRASPGAAAAAPTFSAVDALRAEWRREPPALPPQERAALPPADRARLERTIARIGAPGAPPLAPRDEDATYWKAAALRARTPEARFEALFMLNRKKAQRPLVALAGLGAGDAPTWPRHLHLEGQVAAARLLGDTVTPELQAFLAALPRDPAREQAARLRLVLAQKEAQLLPALRPTPGATLAVLHAWNQGPWERRREAHLALLRAVRTAPPAAPEAASDAAPWAALGLAAPTAAELRAARTGLLVRLLEGLPAPAPDEAAPDVTAALARREPLLVRLAALGAIGKLRGPGGLAAARAAQAAAARDPRLEQALLPSLRAVAPAEADALRARLLAGPDAVARAAAIDDLAAPADLPALARRVFADREVDGQQALIKALDRWKLAPAQRREVLQPFLGHATWIGRLEAWQALAALGPPPPWPTAPPPTAAEARVLAEAERLLARSGRPLRLALTLPGGRRLVLRLDPEVAPLNVANLAALARRGFFDGTTFHRVVPDFVVQGGDPRGTGDGGPGYAVRCEDSLTAYGPGSVGMALSGKDTGGSQLFITTNAAPHLRGRYTHLGLVEDPDRALPMLDALELGARIERAELLP